MESPVHSSAPTSILADDDQASTIPTMSQESFSICLIGGIYGKDDAYRAKVKITPETVLEKGLKARGHRVVTLGHRYASEFDKFDIIHVHHLGYATIRAASDASNTALVYTSHDGPAMAGMLERSHRLAAKFVMSRADAVIALSPAERAFQSRTYQLDGALHKAIPNGIDTRNYRYSRKDCVRKRQQWQLLFVGQLIEQKGVDRLLEALALLPRNVGLQLAFHVDALREELERLARKLGLQERVHFLGRKSPEELRVLYQQADVFVLPSLGEALPSVITEAMICGVPIVATDVGEGHVGDKYPLGSVALCKSIFPVGEILDKAAMNVKSDSLVHALHFDNGPRTRAACSFFVLNCVFFMIAGPGDFPRFK